MLMISLIRSAAITGPWAVPFGAQPPPKLQGLAPPPLPSDRSMIVPEVECFGLGDSSVPGPVFTAPHSICVARDGCADHLPCLPRRTSEDL